MMSKQVCESVCASSNKMGIGTKILPTKHIDKQQKKTRKGSLSLSSAAQTLLEALIYIYGDLFPTILLVVAGGLIECLSKDQMSPRISEIPKTNEQLRFHRPFVSLQRDFRLFITNMTLRYVFCEFSRKKFGDKTRVSLVCILVINIDLYIYIITNWYPEIIYIMNRMHFPLDLCV